MRLAIAFLAALLAGCSALASPGMTYGCQGADVGSTVYAIHRGAAEANPVMEPLTKGGGVVVFAALKMGLAWLLLRPEVSPTIRAAANVFTCGVAAHNVSIAR